MTQHIKSKQRVADHGEVFTPDWLVKDMLDLVKPETERIDARFLEPACGTGNFLIEVLRRKLHTVEKRYAKNQYDYERYAVLALSALYGIDLLEDNAKECRRRLYQTFDQAY
ncbi:MAG: DNA methyltransferase, partial [Candidatus Thermochlorobacter sp.]